MSLYLIRMALHRPHLLRFARAHDLLASRADDPGYLLHAWLAAMFGAHAPKPFYFHPKEGVLFGYAASDEAPLMEHAAAFADPLAHEALARDSLAAKEMPRDWPLEKRLRLHVRVCPVTRKDDEEKDVFLRAMERWVEAGEPAGAKPDRAEVYCAWMARQIEGNGLAVEHVAPIGMRAQVVMQRRSRKDANKGLRYVERPEAEFEMIARITNSARFNELLCRGIGRHRAFGFGMIRLLPA